MNSGSVSADADVNRVYAGCRSCSLNCPCWVTVKDGRAIKIEGDPELGPPNFGKMCVRGLNAIQFEYSPTRVRYPLKRVGKRGEGKWQRISWEQAVQEIAAKTHEMVEKYGPETFVFPGRTGRHDMGWIAHRIARTIGSPNNYYGPIEVCFLPNFVEAVLYGSYTTTGSGVAPTDLYMSYSQERLYSWPVMGEGIMDNLANGMKWIVVDPVKGPAASKATEWVPIRNGSDLAWTMALIRVIIEEGLYKETFVRQWTNASFLVRNDTGALLLESDVRQGGSSKRYLFWDEAANTTKYWDAEEICWQGGPSGKAHYDGIVARGREGKVTFDLSPAAGMPDDISPALYGTYSVALRGGCTIDCHPAFQQLVDNVAEWTPEKAEEITGVSADQTVRVARMVASSPTADIGQSGQGMTTNVSQYVNAVNVVKILTGNVENDGGAVMSQFYPVTPQGFPGEYDISYADGLPLEQKRKRLGYYEHRIGCGYAFEEWQKWHPLRPSNSDGLLLFPSLQCVLEAAETGRPYPVHGIYAISSNWLMHDPTTARWLKLMNDETKIELHVVTEIVMTPTAELADYVLPAVTWLERNYLSFGIMTEGPVKRLFGKAVEPICEAQHDYNFGAMLAQELGKYSSRYVSGMLNSEWANFYAGEYGQFWTARTIDEYRDQLCRKFLQMPLEDAIKARAVMVPGVEFSPDFERHKIAGKFPTDTGKINLFSTLHQKCGYSPLPVYTEPAESPLSRPDLAKDYPLVFSGGKRQPGFFHSEFRQVPWTREMIRTPDVFINPKTAAEYGVAENDWIWVESPPTAGRAPLNKIMGKVSFRLMSKPGVVTYSQHAWWRPEKSASEDLHGAFEWNTGALVGMEDVCPETGTGAYRSQLCKIYKASAEDIAKYQPEITEEQLMSLLPLKEMC